MIIGANPAYLNSTGRTAEDIVGQHIFDAFPANFHDPDSTNLDEVRAALRAGQTVVNRDVLHDSRSAAYADAHARIGVRADLLVPYVKAGKLGVVLPGDHAYAVGVAPAERRAGQPLHIMIVDDNQDAASMLTMLLESSGHEVLVEHDARRARARCEQVSPEVFLLDIGLPDMDGNELGARLRARPATRDVVIVAVTGYGQERGRARTAAAGFDHHLVKPVDIRQLEAILADAGIARNSD